LRWGHECIPENEERLKNLRDWKPAIVIAVAFALCGGLFAQDPGCREIPLMAAMARAKTVIALKAAKPKAGNSYRAQLIFAARMLEIDPQNKVAARSLLNLLPKEELGPEQAVWLSLDQLEQCPSSGVAEPDLTPLFGLQSRLSRDCARAVLLIPGKMFDYVTYAQLSTNPESDYAVQMRKVCRARHAQFVDAVNELSPKDKAWFVSKIFDPHGCRTIFFPEQ
jgi:hypothetical protein